MGVMDLDQREICILGMARGCNFIDRAMPQIGCWQLVTGTGEWAH